MLRLLLRLGTLAAATAASVASARARALVAAAGDEPNLNWTSVAAPTEGAEQSMLPSLECARVITMNASTSRQEVALMTSRTLLPYGLAGVTQIQTQLQAADNITSAEGVFMSHRNAWRESLAMGCEHALIFEDDTFFESRFAALGLANAETFLASGTEFDMLLLGLTAAIPTVTGPPPTPCTFPIEHWYAMHAYIISAEFMELNKDLTWADLTAAAEEDGSKDGSIDGYLQGHMDRGKFYSIYPMFAFQRNHVSSHSVAGEARDTIENYLQSSMSLYHTLEDACTYTNNSYAAQCREAFGDQHQYPDAFDCYMATAANLYEEAATKCECPLTAEVAELLSSDG